LRPHSCRSTLLQSFVIGEGIGDLHLIQKPGIWPQQVTCIAVRYDAVITGRGYTEVDVFCENEIIAQIPVDIVS
jgi:hypothetical protein